MLSPRGNTVYDIGNGEYLQLCVEDGVIDYASIVDVLYHIDTITD